MKTRSLLGIVFAVASLSTVIAARAADTPAVKPAPSVPPTAPPVLTAPPGPPSAPPPGPAAALQFPPLSAKLKLLAGMGHPKISASDLDGAYFVDAGHPVGPGGQVLLGTRWPESSDPVSMRILMSPGRSQRVAFPDGERWMAVAPQTTALLHVSPTNRNLLVDCVFENETGSVAYRVRTSLGAAASINQQTAQRDSPSTSATPSSTASSGQYGAPFHVTEVIRPTGPQVYTLSVRALPDEPRSNSVLRAYLSGCEVTPFRP